MKDYRLHYLSKQEKAALKVRIERSIGGRAARQKNRVLRQILKIAAVLVLCLGGAAFYLLQTSQKNGLESAVSEISATALKYGEVRLVVNDIEEIKIKESSSIIYSSEGRVKLQSDYEEKEILENKPDAVAYNELIVPYGKRTRITLSEGTKVWLNSGSRMVYPPVFSEDTREVYLEGEAIFEVAHNPDKPFFVETQDYKIKVLGTVFNLSSYTDDAYASTALESGKVEIIYKSGFLGKSSKKITKGTLALYDRNSKILETKETDIKPYMTWREGYWEIKDQKLTQILKKLSRYYRVDLVVENTNAEFKELTFSGYLDLKEDIEDVLNVISETSKMTYLKISENKILIK